MFGNHEKLPCGMSKYTVRRSIRSHGFRVRKFLRKHARSRRSLVTSLAPMRMNEYNVTVVFIVVRSALWLGYSWHLVVV